MLVWMDLEMTGLDHTVRRDRRDRDASSPTTSWTIIAEGPDLVVHQPDDVLARMDPFVVEMHTRSGLLDRDQGVDDHARRCRRGHARVHQGARARAGERAAVRQLDRHRPPVPRRLPARDREPPALPLDRRVQRQGAGQALVSRASTRPAAEARAPTGRSTTSASRSASCAYYREHVFVAAAGRPDPAVTDLPVTDPAVDA